MIRSLVLVLCSLCFSPAFAQREVMYHITVRSFFDGNGDGLGDLKGIEQKLDYLKQLGITTISLSPIYQSDFYYNLYAGNLEKIDTKYGTFKEYRDLIQAVHRNKMKLYQEVDLQYVNAKHLWFTDSYKNTKSTYSSYIYYTDLKNDKPIYLTGIASSVNEKAVAVNLKNAKVKEYYNQVLKYWADPDKDGNYNDGVDGFRIIDVQDKIDDSGKTGGQLKDFYNPLFSNLKKVNPNILLVAETSNSKSFGLDLYNKANADVVMSSKFRESILSFDKNKIRVAADSLFLKTTADKYPAVFIEDVNTTRLTSLPGMNAGKLKIAAALNFLLGGMPCIYYGQELGMKGEAPATGTNVDKILETLDVSSVEKEQKDANSLWNYYKQLIRMKKLQPAIALGTYKEVVISNNNVLSFTKTYIDKETATFEQALIMINLSGENQAVSLSNDNDLRIDLAKLILGTPNAEFQKHTKDVVLTPYAVQVWRL